MQRTAVPRTRGLSRSGLLAPIRARIPQLNRLAPQSVPPAGDAPGTAVPRTVREEGDEGSSASGEAPVAPGASPAAPAQPAQVGPQPFFQDALTAEIVSIAVPMLFTLAADPVAGLVDTAYIGRLGAAQLAGTGVALSIFNTVSKLFNVPLLSVTTSNVAAATGRAQAATCSQEEEHAAVSASISSSLAIAVLVGTCQAALLLAAAPWAAGLWGAGPESPLHAPMMDFLTVRALGAPFTVLLLVQQGVYRGLQDTRTPLWATLGSNVLNVVINAGLIFSAGLGVRGAALGTVLSQALPCVVLLRNLDAKYTLSLSDPATLGMVSSLFAPTGFLVLRTGAITATYAVATSLAARAGPSAAACHQVCFQLWLASSLLADSLAVAGQSLLARSLAAKDFAYGEQVVGRVVGLASVLGAVLTVLLAAGSQQLPRLFTSDPGVLDLMEAALPAVVATQGINALAFAWDGVLFGTGGFRFASIQMALCAAPSVSLMLLGTQLAGPLAPPGVRLGWVWAGLALVMGLRAASIWLPHRMRWGPFKVLAPSVKSE